MKDLKITALGCGGGKTSCQLQSLESGKQEGLWVRLAERIKSHLDPVQAKVMGCAERLT